MISRNSFCPNSSQHCGTLSLRSRSCRPLGKISGNWNALPYTTMPSMLDYQSFRSTIRGLTPSLCSSLPWARFFFPPSAPYLCLLITVLHPYYKLDYIKLSQGGAEEQAMEHLGGNPNAKNWQDEVLKIVEKSVSINSQSGFPMHMKQ
jgi:hypothetical protein